MKHLAKPPFSCVTWFFSIINYSAAIYGACGSGLSFSLMPPRQKVDVNFGYIIVQLKTTSASILTFTEKLATALCMLDAGGENQLLWGEKWARYSLTYLITFSLCKAAKAAIVS